MVCLKKILKVKIYRLMSRPKESKQAILTQLSLRQARQLVQLRRYPSKMILMVLPIADDKIKALVKKYPYYAEDTIPSGTYKIKSDVKTVAVKAMLVVTKDLMKI